METSLKKSCLGSLCLANAEAIQNTCKLKFCGGLRINFRIGRKHLGSSTRTRCAMPRTRSRHTRSTQEKWPGCYIRTMDHVISAVESEKIEIQKKTMDWTRELFGRANTEGIHTAIQGLRTKYNGEFDAIELFKELDQIRAAVTHWTFTSPAAMIGIVWSSS
jgi:hypothetical protein